MEDKLNKLAFRNNCEKLEEELSKCTVSQINEPEKGLLFTPIFFSVLGGAVETAKLLIKYGANVNALDVYGRPPLYYIGDPSPVPSATAENRLQVAKLLLDNGADVNIIDVDGAQPLWPIVFNARGKKEELPIVKLLVEHGADPNHINKYGKRPLDIAIISDNIALQEILESHKK